MEPTEQTLNTPVCIHCEKDCQAKGIKPEKKKLSKFFCLIPDCPNLHSYYCSNCTDYHEHKAIKISVLLETMLKAGEEVDMFRPKIMAVHNLAMKEKKSLDEIISLFSSQCLSKYNRRSKLTIDIKELE